MSDRGVSIQFVLDFCMEHNLWEKPTWEVNLYIIQPACKTGGLDGGPCRYVDLPSMVEKGVVGRTQTFVSHAWGAPFGLIVVALLEGEPDMNRHVWIDIFAVLQFDPKPADELRFDLVIPDCSSFLLVVPYVQEIADMDRDAAWDRDMKLISEGTFRMLPMYRVWCLVEIFAALQQLGMVVVMKVGRLEQSGDSIGGYKLNSKGLDNFLFSLSLVVDVKQAKATVDADRVRILEKHKDELPLVDANVRGLCSVAVTGKEDVLVVSLASCAAMGDSVALSRVKEETDVEKSQAYQRVCAGRGFTALLRDLLETYPAEDRDEELLVTAAKGVQVHCVRMLIQEYKLNVNVSDKDGTTPCMYAANGGHTECLRLVLDAGADVNATKTNGDTACMFAAVGGYTECLRLLLEAGSDAKAVANDCQTACFNAAQGGYAECLRLLLEAGADVNSAIEDGWTTCTITVNGGYTECLRLLLEAGVDMNATTKGGTSACMIAAGGGHTECLRMLLEAGADANVASKDGGTALFYASSNKHVDCVALLESYGSRGAELEVKAKGCCTLQ